MVEEIKSAFEGIKSEVNGAIESAKADNASALESVKAELEATKASITVVKDEIEKLEAKQNRSKMNQTEDLIEELYKIGGQDSNIQKILNIRTGLFAQETAIDFSKNASGAFHELDITTSSIKAMNISAVSSFDPAQALRLISSLEGNPISNVGEEGIRNLGRRIGRI